MLNYRRYALDKIPEQHREWVKPFVQGGSVVVMDNRLDAHSATCQAGSATGTRISPAIM